MPIYEYKCVNCGVFEVMQRITEDPLKTCPKCGGAVSRLIAHNVAVIYRGSGFYTTDNRSKEYRERAKEDKGEAKAADS